MTVTGSVSPIILRNDGYTRILIHRDLYDWASAIYGEVGSTATDPLFNELVEEIEQGLAELLQYIAQAGEGIVQLLTVLVGVAIEAARHSIPIRPFMFMGKTGKSKTGKSKTGDLTVYEL